MFEHIIIILMMIYYIISELKSLSAAFENRVDSSRFLVSQIRIMPVLVEMLSALFFIHDNVDYLENLLFAPLILTIIMRSKISSTEVSRDVELVIDSLFIAAEIMDSKFVVATYNRVAIHIFKLSNVSSQSLIIYVTSNHIYVKFGVTCRRVFVCIINFLAILFAEEPQI